MNRIFSEHIYTIFQKCYNFCIPKLWIFKIRMQHIMLCLNLLGYRRFIVIQRSGHRRSDRVKIHSWWKWLSSRGKKEEFSQIYSIQFFLQVNWFQFCSPAFIGKSSTNSSTSRCCDFESKWIFGFIAINGSGDTQTKKQHENLWIIATETMKNLYHHLLCTLQ